MLKHLYEYVCDRLYWYWKALFLWVTGASQEEIDKNAKEFEEKGMERPW